VVDSVDSVFSSDVFVLAYTEHEDAPAVTPLRLCQFFNYPLQFLYKKNCTASFELKYGMFRDYQ